MTSSIMTTELTIASISRAWKVDRSGRVIRRSDAYLSGTVQPCGGAWKARSFDAPEAPAHKRIHGTRSECVFWLVCASFPAGEARCPNCVGTGFDRREECERCGGYGLIWTDKPNPKQ